MSIFDQVLDFIGQPESARFEALALAVFRYQFDSIAPYRRYCLERGLDPDSVASIDEIPPVSTLAFKYAELSNGAAQRVFITSGTTLGARGRHFVPRLEVYRASAMRHFARMLFPDRQAMRILAMHPTADRMPESSLGQMISWCIEEFASGPVLCAATREAVAIDESIGFLRTAQSERGPVCILATTAALAALLAGVAATGSALQLPAGSRVMDTGGDKGQVRPLTREGVGAGVARWLGIAPAMVVNEYGMTEMCSQLYDVTALNRPAGWTPGAPKSPALATDAVATGAERPALLEPKSPARRPALLARRLKLPPPWLRAIAVDPVTLRRLPEGAVGLLAFFDLANVGSVSAIVTEDFGAIEHGAVSVIRRAGGGDPRGCALGVAEFAGAEARRPI